ncbi:MAG TPA: helix-turn-helix domain-containing protein [Acidobacteriota bacterium]|nr:helix-turn-helix domain-containing protein [Acidobacteriota bacterium]HNT17007.1 helix-turn-helix domain-containing protein [Acidobacteriota bacterium]
MKKVLTTFDAARLIGVSPYTIRLWIIKGILPAYSTPGGHRRIKLEELDDFLKKNRMPIPEKIFGGKWRALLSGFSGERVERKRIEGGLKGFQCFAASTGVETGFLMLKLDPALVIADMDRGGSDWKEVGRIIRVNPELSHINILGVSSAVDLQLVSEAEKAGFYEVLQKPVDGKELSKLVRGMFGKSRF